LGEKKPAIFFTVLATIFYFVKYLLLIEGRAPIFWIDLTIRFSVSIYFNILMQMNWEIYPTDIRSLAVNMNKLFSRIGDFSTPILMEQNLPLITLFVSAMNGIMFLMLFKIKETQGQSLEEVTNIEKDDSKKN